MRTRFLSLRAFSFRGSYRGFTLTELLVSIGIIGLVTAVVLIRYGSFDSSTLLKNAAYDIALSLREAQIKSISVVRGSDGFDYPYGVSVAPNTAQYLVFRDDLQGKYLHYAPGDDELLSTVAFGGRSIVIDETCVTLSSSDRDDGQECGLSRLDILFQRPEFNAIMFAEPVGGGEIEPSEILEARIIVSSTQNPDERFYVKVTQLGQISVCKEGAPNCR